jgi:hypothetical protein
MLEERCLFKVSDRPVEFAYDASGRTFIIANKPTWKIIGILKAHQAVRPAVHLVRVLHQFRNGKLDAPDKVAIVSQSTVVLTRRSSYHCPRA